MRIAVALESPPPFQERAPRPRRVLPLAATAALAAGFAVALVWPRPAIERAGMPQDDVRTESASMFGFFVTHGDRVRRGGPRETVIPHDRIQLHTTTTKPTWVAVFGDDGATRHLYYVAELAPGREQRLPLSLEIEDTLGEEIVTAVFCPGPFDIASPPPSCASDRFTLVKR